MTEQFGLKIEFNLIAMFVSMVNASYAITVRYRNDP